MFHWTSFLQDEVFDYLQLHSPLNLTRIVTAKHKPNPQKVFKGDGAENDDRTVFSNNLDPGGKDLVSDPRAIQDIATQEHLLPTILEHNQREEENVFKSTLFTCQVCFMEKLGALCLKFHDCDHVYCKECMKSYFEVQIKEGNVNGLICPYDKCESQAHPGQVCYKIDKEFF